MLAVSEARICKDLTTVYYKKMSSFKDFMTGQALGKQWTDDKIILPTWFDHLKEIFFLRISVQKGFAHLLYHFPSCWKC